MSEADESGPGSPTIVQWIIDTRTLWPVPKKTSPREEVAELKNIVCIHIHIPNNEANLLEASRALAFLSASEQAAVLKYYHVKDAKMSLASQLLKHLVIMKYCHVPWSKTAFSRDSRGKPFWPPPGLVSADHVKIGFNVSHQAGLVSMIAVIGGEGDVEVGTDIVCVNERLEHDYRQIDREGLFSWLDVYADVFAESEVSFMKLAPVKLDLGKEVELKGFGNDALSRCQWRNRMLRVETMSGKPKTAASVTLDSNVVIDAKMRRFYAMWCLREAYVKMTGEALLAPWLKELEILNVDAPAGNGATQDPASLQKGQVVRDFSISFKGRPVTKVRMELTALGENYMVAASARSPTGRDISSLEMGDWQLLDLESDVLAFGGIMP
jgi:4'-phosphopantetheinyl transferase